jgi:hypothetical protein
MPKQTMPTIDIESIADLNDDERKLAERILRPDGRLRASKPSVPHKIEIKTGHGRFDTAYRKQSSPAKPPTCGAWWHYKSARIIDTSACRSWQTATSTQVGTKNSQKSRCSTTWSNASSTAFNRTSDMLSPLKRGSF